MSEQSAKPSPTSASRQPRLRYQDRHDLDETFADSIRSCVFDGQLMRIEFTVSRFDDPGALGVLEGRQVPACRLVLNRTALADLFNRLGQLSNVLKQAGVVSDQAAGGATPASGTSTKN
ncbi:MAG TPA: hypothetical protein VNR11_11965 [Xanthobacteraceae bacterium]|nr:hypothetical protein [Xanthobacteraceae bacterium]